MPLVSVIIPSHNRRDFLECALESVFKQSFKNLEVIVVDDASSDDTQGMLQQMTDPRLITIKNSKNAGVSYSRNKGIEASRGDYIAFLDSDDQWQKRKLEKQIAFLESFPHFDLVHCNEKWIRNGSHLNQKKIHRKEGGDLFKRSLSLCLIAPSAVVMKRQLLDEIGGFRESYPVCEDYEMWLRITSQREVGFIEDILVIKHGGHQDQLSMRFKAMDYWRVKAMDEVFQSNRLNKQQKSDLTEVLVKKALVLKAGYQKYPNARDLAYIESLLQKYQKCGG